MNISVGWIEQLHRKGCTFTMKNIDGYTKDAFTQTEDRATLESDLSAGRGLAN
jgi:hypothetical protein